MTVSEVGRMAIACSSFDLPLASVNTKHRLNEGWNLRVRDPGYLGSKAFDMCFLLLQLCL